ncbi:unnamed protein product [Orchesella dallaii]|uniref:Metalloendopeptidase n=1 Tax=Orchesella dallaii TaxID=48710 RepID=A0ABP1RVE8_9HEXA
MLYYILFTILIHLWKLIATEAYFQCDTSQRAFQPYAKWPNGILTYEFHSSLTAEDRNATQMAFDDIQSKTCVRFQNRSNENDYVSIKRDENVCGWAHYCKIGGKQVASVGKDCSNLYTLVHELGHSLCLGHEHQRFDRDDFLQFKNCHANEIPPKDTNIDTRGTLYDYNSVMHNACGNCGGGWPKMSGVSENQCTRKNNEGLSVLDADKLNEFYECQGCYTHRWHSIEQLTEEDKNNMVSFGTGKTPGDPYYLCRGYVGGAIHAGKYWKKSGICYLPYGGREHFGTKLAQVFTLPGGNTRTECGRMYETVLMNEFNIRNAVSSGILARAVKIGRKVGGVECYAATAVIYDNSNGKETAIGTVCKDNLNRAYFPEAGLEYVKSEYNLIVCSN